MADPHRYSVSVAAAVVSQDGRMLAIKRRDNGHWEPPGGVLEPGEPAAEGMAREVKEETGLDVEAVRLSGVYQNLSRDIVSLVFEARQLSGRLRTSDESVQVEWLTEDQVRGRMTEAYAVRLLDAVRAGERVTHVRTHDGRQLI